mgnify:CR=1 FL=1|tara:strand:- start:136 stop:366 length:231 start_codon:yes stop_codon:yes gene_type:complete
MGGNKSTYVILEKKDFARINLRSQSISEMNILLPIERGVSVFPKEVAEGDLFKFPILRTDCGVIEIEITAEITIRN